MARLPALVEAIAAYDERSETLIAQYARVLREKDEIISDRAGLGAALMTVDDATTLLMATLGAATPAAGPDAVAQMRRLRPLVAERYSEDHPLDVIHGLPFETALRHCIKHAKDISEWAATYKPKAKGNWFDDGPWTQITGDAPRTRMFNIAIYNGGAFAELTLGGGRRAGGLFDHMYTVDGGTGANFSSGYGCRGAGIDLLLALQKAVDAPVQPRSWKRKRA